MFCNRLNFETEPKSNSKTAHLLFIFYYFWLYFNKLFILPCLWPTSARGFYEQSWYIPEVASRLPRPLERERIHQI